MKILNNNGNGCRERATEEVAEAWRASTVIRVLEVISRVKKIEARFHKETDCSGHVVGAGVQSIRSV